MSLQYVNNEKIGLLAIYIQRISINSCLTMYTKINLKWYIGLSICVKSIKNYREKKNNRNLYEL